MKKFIIQASLFLIILITINLVLHPFLNKYYGNEYYQTKFSYFEKNKSEYNTVIFGSSRLYRHINTKLLDSLLNEYNISSFNLAAPATFNPEMYFLYDNFIKSTDNSKIKFSLIELQPLSSISKVNLATTRSSYWLNLRYLSFSIKYILNKKISTKKKLSEIAGYTFSYIYKYFDFHKYKVFFTKNKSDKKIIGENGYYSLTRQMIDTKGGIGLKKRVTDFLKDTTVLQKRKEISEINLKSYNQFLNITHLEELENIIRISKEKGIHVFFVIPPRLFDYKELKALKKYLPKENVLDISNGEKYPNLYKTKYAFDLGHLNDKGARLFTEYLVDEIKKNL